MCKLHQSTVSATYQAGSGSKTHLHSRLICVHVASVCSELGSERMGERSKVSRTVPATSIMLVINKHKSQESSHRMLQVLNAASNQDVGSG